MSTPPDPVRSAAQLEPLLAPGSGLLDAVLRASQSLLVILDRHGRIVRFNSRCEEVSGYSAEEAAGREVWTFLLRAEDVELAKAAFRELTAGLYPRAFENDWVTKAGEHVRIAWSTWAVTGQDGSVEYVIGAGTDVTDRRRLQEALRESEALRRAEQARHAAETRLAGVLSLAADAVLMLDESQRITFFNEGAERIFGFEKAEVMGRPLDILIPERFRAAHREHIGRFAASTVAARQMGERQEIYGLRKSGEEFPAEASIARLTVDGQSVFAVVLRDITERKHGEEALRLSEAKFAGIVSIAADAIVSVDEAQRIVLFNQGAERIFGYAAADILGQPLDILIPARFRGAHRAHVEAFGRSPVTARRMGERQEIFGLRKNGEIFPAEASISRIEVGGRRLFTVVLRDVTERKEAEEEKSRLLVRERAARAVAEVAERQSSFLSQASAILDSSLDYEVTLKSLAELVVPALATLCIIDVVDDDGRVRRLQVIHANPEREPLARELSRYPRDPTQPFITQRAIRTGRAELVPEVSEELLRPLTQDEEHLAIMRALAPKSYMVVPLIARGAVLGAIALIADASGRRYGAADLGFIEDLSRRAALAIDNARLYRSAQRAIRLREQVLGVVSHDLRNPLSVISMCTSSLARAEDEPPSPALVREMVGTIRGSAEWMHRMIDDLLDISSIEAGRLSLERRVEDPIVLLVRALNMCEEGARAKGLVLEPNFPERLPSVAVDADRVLQVLGNVLGNAIKFTEPGGRITVSALQAEGAVRIAVADTGVGIAREHLPHIFDRFWQARKTSRVRGTGLGLAVAKGIVEAHGGRIWVESTPGLGAAFYFTLPTAATAPAAASEV